MKHFLKFVPFSKFDLWDTKRYTSKSINSDFEVIKLGSCIREENKKYKLYLEEEKEFGILGVNNKTGIFDAYTQKGKEINQPYKKMETGWIAYNPYRINVGSIGIRLEEHLNEYISPAYVVFSCKENLLPEYLFLVFKTDIFNKVINENTTGSVRQNLSFDKLKDLEIPLPTLQEQQAIVDAYFSKINKASQLEIEANNIDKEIEKYLFDELGIKLYENNQSNTKLNFIQFKDISRWDGVNQKSFFSIYPICKMGDIIKSISTGTTPPTNRPEYFDGSINFYTPADLGNDMYLIDSSRTITEKAIVDKKARIFEKGTILFVGIGSTVGKVGIVNNEIAACNQQITGFNINNNVSVEYIFYFLHYFKNITISEKSISTIPIINQDKIINIPIAIPSFDKQKEISNVISSLRKNKSKKLTIAAQLKHQANEAFERAIFQ